jgi:type IV pilus modification protein PilV
VKQQRGLTLIEVMVAMILISIGVIAAAALQGTALKNTSKAQAVNEVTELAENELEWQRQSDASASTCESDIPSGYTCTLTIVPCTIQSGAIVCSASTTSPKAYQMTVTVTGSQQSSVTLTTIVADKLYAGRIASN